MDRQLVSIARSRSIAALLLAGLCTLALIAAGCDDSPTSPSDRAVVTFAVGDETFRVQLVNRAQVDAARAAQNGGPASIPNGRIVPGTGDNTNWNWHLEDLEFVEVAIELCDGRPSDVERAGTQFGGGRFCPWSARVLAIDAD